MRLLASAMNGYSPDVWAQRLNNGTASILRWVNTGLRTPDGETVRLRAVRVGSQIRITEEAMNEFLEAFNGAEVPA